MILPALALALPLLTFLVLGIGNKRIDDEFAKLIAFSNMAIASFISIYLVYHYGLKNSVLETTLGDWIRINKSYISWKIYLDSLSMLILAIVTIISTLVHLYSIGYMKEDKNLVRFLAYLSLFTFAMMLLVTSHNFLQLFLGWEGVGVCSYLLIGFWHYKDSASKAATKAFIINRISDFAFIVAILFIFFYCDSLEFNIVFSSAAELASLNFYYGFSVLDVICSLLFIGCMGKSAQIILHSWLPDAMEGPTPVSALIHAATMVTAGVFLLARASYLFEYSNVLPFITIIGLITSLYGALMALAQVDIKKIIAFSTISQLGYMVLACGLSAYDVAIFHLATHAFFKALLFLAAGSVICATNEQNIYKFGGLYKTLPITYILFLIGTFAIIGIYPFAGYYSKEAILALSYNKSPMLFYALIFGVAMTALYSIKIILFVFHGIPKIKSDEIHTESTFMIAPMIILAIGAIFSGWYLEHVFNIIDASNSYLNNGSVFILKAHKTLALAHSNIIEQVTISVIITSFFIMLSYFYFQSFRNLCQKFSYLIFDYFDVIYSKILVRFFCYISHITTLIDIKIFEGLGPKMAVYALDFYSKQLKKLHTGFIANYISYVLLVFLLMPLIIIAYKA